MDKKIKKVGKLTVDLAGDWKLYTQTIPLSATPLGVVTRNDGDGSDADTGALVRVGTTGLYFQVNAGVVRSLDGRSVSAAMGTGGRPKKIAGGRNVNLYLDEKTLELAEKIGHGNLSGAIRLAIGEAANKRKL